MHYRLTDRLEKNGQLYKFESDLKKFFSNDLYQAQLVD